MRSLHHRVLSMGRTCVPGWFAGVSFGLGPLKVLLISVKIFGCVHVAVSSSIASSCSQAAMFGYGPGFVSSFFRSRYSPSALCPLAVLLVE